MRSVPSVIRSSLYLILLAFGGVQAASLRYDDRDSPAIGSSHRRRRAGTARIPFQRGEQINIFCERIINRSRNSVVEAQKSRTN